MATPFLPNFKLPNLVVYDGKGNPKAHVDIQYLDGLWKSVRDNTMKSIPINIDGTTQAWHTRLQHQSIVLFV